MINIPLNFGEAAIEAILDGQRNVMIGTMNGKIVYVPFAKAIKHDKGIDRGALELVKILSIYGGKHTHDL